MSKFYLITSLCIMLINANEHKENIRQISVPSAIAMQKEERESFCMSYIRHTYGIPVNCHPGACCCYVCCCPCVSLAGLYFTIKDRNKS